MTIGAKVMADDVTQLMYGTRAFHAECISHEDKRDVRHEGLYTVSQKSSHL